jgi:hypothetical protein
MGLGVAKVDKDAIAQILSDEPAKTGHPLCDAFLIGRDNFTKVFRVHATRECRRTNEVREHHRHLPALGGIVPRSR